MKYLICLAALLWAGMKLTAADNVKEVEIKIIETSDVHGNFFPYNFIEKGVERESGACLFLCQGAAQVIWRQLYFGR